MIPHVQDDKRQTVEQPLSPGWFRHMLASARWWRNMLFVRLSGAVLLFLGGLSPLFAPATWPRLCAYSQAQGANATAGDGARRSSQYAAAGTPL